MSLLKTLKESSIDIKVLYVEDDKALLESIFKYLSLIFSYVQTAENGKEGLDKYAKESFDIVITDIKMPKMNGLEMIEKIREINSSQEILITTAFSEANYLSRAIELDVSGYIIKPINFEKINATLHKVVARVNMSKENERYKMKLEEMVEQRTMQNLMLQREKIDNYEKTLLSLVKLVEKRDTYTGGHSQRVANYSKLIAKHMGFSQEECKLIYKAGILHDIGKIETPDAVLLNPGKLDDLQLSIIKEHVVTGTRLLENIPMYSGLSKIISQHHERYDGKGYPLCLKKDEILPLAQIMIVTDAFDAMTTNRIYKPRIKLKDALIELSRFSGTQFHPEVIKYAIEVLKDVRLDENIFQLPSSDMEEKKFAFFFEDQLTNAYNKTYLELIFVQNKNSYKRRYINALLFHNFGKYNSKFGWNRGNIFLKNVVSILKKHYNDSYIFRLNGDDFVVMSNGKIPINVSMFDELLDETDRVLHIEKKTSTTKEINSLEKLEKFMDTSKNP
ncbi:MAG: response regulator [Sulfurospirillum sp.]